jgi:cytochrome P450
MAAEALLDLGRLNQPEFIGAGDPHALWRRMRADAPVSWTPEADGPGFWSVTRYDDGVRVLKDAAGFSSARGTTLEGDRWSDDPAADKMLALMDAPRHTELRRLLNPFFAPRQVSAIEAGVAAYVETLVRRGAEQGEFDFGTEIASRLPVGVFFTMMDIPAADWDTLFDIILRTVAASDDERAIADGELLLYLFELTAARRAKPGADLLSTIATAELGAQRLSLEEAVLSCANLLSAGIYTTRLATTGGLQALLEYPDQLRALRADPARLAGAVEEIVRWTTPGLAFYRTAAANTVVGEQPVRAGERVVVWLPSLNRDERIFSAPDRFDIGRNPNRHVGFGAGPHSCIGAAFARLELRVLFAVALAGWKEIAPAGEATRLRSLVLHGIDRLPVRVVPC